MNPKSVHIIGGGTVFHVRPHLALSAPAYGGTARALAELCGAMEPRMDIVTHLTRMADPKSPIETNSDLQALVYKLMGDLRTKIVFFNAAVADFEGEIEGSPGRLRTQGIGGELAEYHMRLTPASKLVKLFRRGDDTHPARKDIFLVAFKATAGATPEEQYRQGLIMLKRSSANLVLANDVTTRYNMIITPEEASYHGTYDRAEALRNLVDMAYLRSHLTFTRSTVVAGEPVPWDSHLVPASLRRIVDHCIAGGAYKEVDGVTAGHFAVKLGNTTFLTSRRRTNFNRLAEIGLVRVETDGPDNVIAYGSRPSVGGQSQRIVFSEHPGLDCIVHFHCPKKAGSPVPTVSQREYECGSHQCGANTSRGLRSFGEIEAVYLDNHGPNVVFNRDIDPEKVIAFIDEHFDLSQKSGGYQLA